MRKSIADASVADRCTARRRNDGMNGIVMQGNQITGKRYTERCPLGSWGFSHECLGVGIATVEGINKTDGTLMRMTGDAAEVFGYF